MLKILNASLHDTVKIEDLLQYLETLKNSIVSPFSPICKDDTEYCTILMESLWVLGYEINDVTHP